MTWYFEDRLDGIDWPLLESPGQQLCESLYIRPRGNRMHEARGPRFSKDRSYCMKRPECLRRSCSLNGYHWSVGHTGHSVLFATLEDPLNTGLLVEFLVLAPTFPGEQSTQYLRQKAGRINPFAVVPCRTKCSDFVFCIVRAVERIPFPDSEVTTEGWPCFCYANNFHVVLCVNCICNTLSDCTVSVDCDLNDHTAQHRGKAEHP